jgi:hypothetical protein
MTTAIETKKETIEIITNSDVQFVSNNGYETLSEALIDFQKKGYTYDFNLNEKAFFDDNDASKPKPEDFEIVEYYRFEGNGDPSDNSIIYAISSDKHHIRGFMINAYGIYSDDATDDLLLKIKMKVNHTIKIP